MNFLPLPGTPIEELDTPALVIDLPTFEANIAKLHGFFEQQVCKVSPTVKSHKCPDIAHRQLAAGGNTGAICVAKVGEAEVMAQCGINHIRIINQVVGRTKVRRLVHLARNVDLTVCVDDGNNVDELSEAAQAIGATLSCLVEINVGLNRSGVEPGKPALELAQWIARSPRLRFAGLLGYEGGMVVPDFEERSIKTRERIQLLLDSKELIEDSGLPVEIASAGGTGTWNITGVIDGVTEVNPGSYVFMDMYHFGYCPDFEISLKVLSTVLSKPRAGTAVIDCGHHGIGLDYSSTLAGYIPNFTGLPAVESPRGARVNRLNAEHGVLDLKGGEAENLRPGDKVVMVPASGDAAANLHDYFFGIRDGKVETVWPIEARGAIK